MLKLIMRLKVFTFLLIFISFAFGQTYCRGIYRNKIALTFDDGPNPLFTEFVLDILRENNIKATFFLVGKKVKENPELLLEIANEGHEIGNHTYYHSRTSWINNNKLLDEIDLTSEIILREADKQIKLFRPPHGVINSEKRAVVEKAGYHIVMWSVNADDFSHAFYGMRNSQSISRRVLSRITGGDIVLMHDSSAQTIVALPIIIKELKRRGFSFATVSEITGLF
ncbi:MAG: xylanase/chitin deacetylase [Candidatus Saganbacteria bacterium]|uniref:Xylanase/chitin deacetylase n=1 Tax=Candidatus Saganbacteria bacterium TaxID=2575572 RepID=A0A833L216_UNCSA|nr:MAG: xylanase/chitin deacetylase [Candidatus Saganbacteria bacterium]